MWINLRSLYKKHFLFRVTVQLLIVFIVYSSIRYWQALDDIKGEAPAIVGTTISGSEFDLHEYRGAPVLVHFWASWCPICEIENPSIAALAKNYPVITIAAWSDTEKEVSEYLQQEQLDMPVLVDDEGQWVESYGVSAVPMSFILDGDGNITFIERGYTSSWGLKFRMWLSSD